MVLARTGRVGPDDTSPRDAAMDTTEQKDSEAAAVVAEVRAFEYEHAHLAPCSLSHSPC